jgi:multicomponent Na+:H+ antiporter subunit G
MIIQTIVAFVFVVGGLFFLLVSSIGILRLPDFYTRCHAIGKSETLGSMLLLMGLAIYNGLDINSFKLIVILLFIAFANPTATHIIIGVALKAGVQPWTLKNRKPSVDSFAEEGTSDGSLRGPDK